MRWLAVAVTLMSASCGRFNFDDHPDEGSHEIPDGLSGVPDGSVGPDAVRSCGVPRAIDPQGFYSADFNEDVDGWQPTDESGNPPGFRTPVALDDWGGVEDEYWAGAPGEPDRMLSVYRTGLGKALRWQRGFVNTTSATITQVTIAYDAEAAWARYDAATPRSAQLWWWLDGVRSPAVVLLNNAALPSGRDVAWLCDDEMTSFGMARRDAQVVFSGLSIAPGASWSLHAGFDSRNNIADERHLNAGIDNVIVTVTTQ